MILSRNLGNGPLTLKFPLVQNSNSNPHEESDEDISQSDEESTRDLPEILNQNFESGVEAMFVSGNLFSNFLNATLGSSFSSPGLPFLGVAFQHVLPAELRDVTLPLPLHVDAISSLPMRPPLPPGSAFITVSANSQAEVSKRIFIVAP